MRWKIVTFCHLKAVWLISKGNGGVCGGGGGEEEELT